MLTLFPRHHRNLLATKNPTWQGIGMGLTLFGLAGLAVDYFSQNRADAYYALVMKTLNGG